MSLAVPFSTVTELFVNLTNLFHSSEKPLLMRKRGGKYETIDYYTVREMVTMLAGGLQKLGVKSGDKLAILSENRPEWVVADMAILLLGGIDVPIYPTQTAKQIEFILNDAEVSVILVSNQFQLTKILKIRQNVPTLRHIILINEPEKTLPTGIDSYSAIIESGRDVMHAESMFLRDASRSVKPSDVCTIIYTSGTTGNPKGVMLTHSNFVSNIIACSEVLSINEEDTLLSFLPLSHVFERMAGYYTAIACGACVAYAESIETVAENLLEVKPTIVCSVPRLFERIYNRIARKVEKDPPLIRNLFNWSVQVGRQYAALRKKGSIPFILRTEHVLADTLVFSKLRARTGGRIRYFISGGAALSRELGEFFEAVGLQIIEGYGLTESSPVITVNRPKDYRFGSVGKPIPGIEVRIADDGEILTRGPHVMLGYYKNRKATDETIDKEGWLHTGDIGTIDEFGNLYITDRKKHLFVSSGGKNIAPQVIESLFAGSEFIDQFVLIGDKRMFLTALIVPDFNVIKEYADSRGIPYQDVKELTKNPEILSIIEKKIQETQKDLANYEKVRRFSLLDHPLTIENGELTPTLKIRRREVETRYRDLIEAMYALEA